MFNVKMIATGLMTLTIAAGASAGHRGPLPPICHTSAIVPLARVYAPIGREVVIPARYETVYRKVWVEPLYEVRTRQVWVPGPSYDRGVSVNFGSRKFHFGLDLGPQRCGTGYYKNIREQVLVRPGYWDTVAEQVLVRPERVEVVYNYGPRY